MKTTMTFELIVPKWAKWVAQDYSGWWNWFEKKPTPITSTFYSNSYWCASGQIQDAGQGPVPKNWKEELYEVIQ